MNRESYYTTLKKGLIVTDMAIGTSLSTNIFSFLECQELKNYANSNSGFYTQPK